MKITKTSSITGIKHTREIDVSEEQLGRIELREELIQRIVPHLSADDREFLLTGITPEEWERFTLSEQEDEEEEWLSTNEEDPFSCPNCGRFCGQATDKPTSFVEKGDTEFIDYPDPHYEWKEKHVCLNCGTRYIIVNGT